MRQIVRPSALDFARCGQQLRRGCLGDGMRAQVWGQVGFEPAQYVASVTRRPHLQLLAVPLAGDVLEAIDLAAGGFALLGLALLAWINAGRQQLAQIVPAFARIGERHVLERS